MSAAYDFTKKKLGAGSYGEVTVAVRKSDGRHVAVKKSRCDAGIPYTTIREIACLRAVTHRNVVPLIDIFVSRAHACLVFPAFAEDLYAHIGRCGPLPLNVIKQRGEELFSALDHLHQRKIIHRDLKPSNILVDASGSFHIADFGLAKWAESFTCHTTQVVTLQYRAPEILSGSDLYTESSDIWSLGCILAETATAEILFFGRSEAEQLRLLMDYLGHTPAEKVSEDALRKTLSRLLEEEAPHPGSHLLRFLPDHFGKGQDLFPRFLHLLEECLVGCPDSRCTAAQALHHDFFSAMDID